VKPQRIEYARLTGEYFIGHADGQYELVGRGYAGHLEGLNNPALQHVRNVGPLPAGDYLAHLGKTHQRLGRLAIYLEPLPETEMYGRSGFWCHGNKAVDLDGNGVFDDVSLGCPIAELETRDCLNRWIAEGVTLWRVRD
jgi:hypothetical protein